MNNKVLLGMSGGTDSSVSAILLQEQGYEVIGITLDLFENKNDTFSEYINDAKELADKLGINHMVYNARQQFKETVLDYFVAEYLSGRTPFPCAICNPTIKWKIFETVANELDCQFIATGHYANIAEHLERKYITAAVDPEKDQSFFLWSLSAQQLERIIFPLGDFLKEDIRKKATERGFEKIATKKDSLGICFIQGGNYRPYLDEMIREKGERINKGEYLNSKGESIGFHEGYPYYTIGQRRGLNHGQNKALFVTSIDASKNQVQLGEFPELMKQKIWVKNYRFVHTEDINPKKEYIVKIRYRNQATPCHIEIIDNETLVLHLHEDLHSVAPGQSAVLFDTNRVIAGGLIECSE